MSETNMSDAFDDSGTTLSGHSEYDYGIAAPGFIRWVQGLDQEATWNVRAQAGDVLYAYVDALAEVERLQAIEAAAQTEIDAFDNRMVSLLIGSAKERAQANAAKVAARASLRAALASSPVLQGEET